MNGNIISFFIDSSTKYEDRIVYFRQISEFLSGLECNYPFFNEWLDKVYHELNQGKRTVIILVDKPSGKIIGLAILKDSVLEKKICTLRVASSHQHQGCGSYLIEQSIKNSLKRKSILFFFLYLFTYIDFVNISSNMSMIMGLFVSSFHAIIS